MRVVRIISLIARLALMATMVLGLLFWIAHLSFLSMLLSILAQIGFTSIHEVFGFTGVLFLLLLSAVALRTRGVRMLALAGVIYAFLVPVFGLNQAIILVGNLHWLIQVTHLLVGIGAMYLALGIEKRYQQLKLGGQSAPSSGRETLQAE